ncbi:ATP-dependent helicase DinG [Lysinibacillus sp. PLM2]|nr:ATP-dependent helicase DinG [Lysinibacillus sp. PLM2]
MESQKYVIADLETTGHSPASGDRMIQIALVIMKDWVIEKTFTTFIHPGKSIPLHIQDLTNITDADVQDALPFEAHADTIYELMNDAIFVAHNVDFDLSFLQAEFVRAGLPQWRGKKIDTVELAKILYPMSFSYKLGDLALDLNIPLNQAHRADDDALACALLLKKCWEELLALPLTTLEQLHKYSFRLRSNISQLFFDALQLKRNKVQEHSNFFFYNQLALKKRKEKHEINNIENVQEYPVLKDQKSNFLKKATKNFEERPQQYEMMDIVWNSLNENNEVVIEASTGIGKTLGYLLPSILFAKKSNRKVCISTYTSHLLEQLLYSEIPKLENMLGNPINVVLLKGMQNYIDLERFEQMMRLKDLSYDEILTFLQVIVWLTKTETGDMGELNVSGGGQLFLEKIRKIPDGTNKKRPPFDFYEQAIKDSEKSDLIITNHSMLIADLNRRDPIFHNIGGFIIDEAHQFVQAASVREESILTYTNWKYAFGQVGITSDEQLLFSIKKLAQKYKIIPMQFFHQLDKKFEQIVELFDAKMNYLARKMKSTMSPNKYETKLVHFLNELELDAVDWKEVSNAIQSWIDLAGEITKQFENQVEQITKDHVSILEQWKYWIREFKIKVSEWDDIFLLESNRCSTWVEMDIRNIPGSIRIMKKPIDVQETVYKLFESIRKNSSIIWTSGTMTVPNNKRFIAEQLGIHQKVPIYSLHANSEYYSGAKAFIVNDIPEIQAVSQNEYIESVAQAITRIVRTTQGRCFVLFTSQDMLRKTVELIQESELLEDYMLFAQGVSPGSRMRLLKSFQKFNHSVLFGTNSFWEGVDVPGEGLSAVIVVRLPFTAPEEPTFKAKSLNLQKQGRNPFKDLSLPEAIIRFKQGFGRLIRTSSDKGVFIVLDRRIDTKSYGKEFIEALPPISVQKLPLQDMVLELEHWYNS